MTKYKMSLGFLTIGTLTCLFSMDLDGNVRMTLDCPADRVGLDSILQVIIFALCLQEASDGMETRP